MPTVNEPVLTVTPEAEQIARMMRAWLNTYPDKPMRMVDVEFLGETSGLSISTVQAAYKTRKYITGGYQAQYQFSILYQTIPQTANERLNADEVLNNYAAWAIANAKTDLPARMPAGCRFNRLTQNTIAALLGRDESGTEVHQILFTLNYEVT